MARAFLGVGWAFPVQPGATRAIDVAAYEDSIRQSIGIILGTAKGERLMRPDFGCDIHALVFEPQTAATASKLAEAVRDALLYLEPRIELVDVDVEAEDGDAVLNISVDYRVRTTNNAFNLVFPFYLERGPGA